MTCIVAVETREGVIMGGDAAAVNSNTLELDRVATPKIWRDGPLVIGYTASFRFGQILQYHLDVSQPPKEEDDCMTWVVTDYIGVTRAALKAAGWLRQDGDREQTGEMLIGVRRFLFYIGPEFEVIRATRGYQAVGCGGGYALGSLFSTRSPSNGPATHQQQRIHEALSAAAEHSAGVVTPFTILKNWGV